MKPTTHTPGPWKFWERAGGTVEVVEMTMGPAICEVNVNGFSDQALANAALIAAAPRLLEIAEISLGNIQSMKSANPGVRTWDVWETELMDVISQAKGR